MDKGLTVPKWVLINRPKIPQMHQNLSAQIVCPIPKIWNFYGKRLYLASIVRVLKHCIFFSRFCTNLADFLSHISELEAYSTVLSALRAQGELTKE